MTKKNPKNPTNDDTFVINTHSRWFNVVLILICFFFMLGARLIVNPPATGDEPHYLIMDYSLLHDHDLSLANNYDHHTPLGLTPNPPFSYQGWPHVEARFANKQYSAHGHGLPLILLPGFLLGQATGAMLEMVLIATGVVVLTWVWTKQVTKNRKLSYVAAGLLAACYFFNTQSGSIYPDLLIAALSLIALITIDRYYRNPHFRLLTSIVLGFLVIVHLKAILITVPALLVLCFKVWRTERRLPWAAIAIVVAFIAYYFLTLHQWFGVWSLSQVEGGQSFGASPLHNASAMLFDVNRGLLVYNPIFLLLFVGLPLWLKQRAESLIITLVILLPTIGALCMIPNWNGSASPTGRYLMEFLPAFIPAIVFALEKLNQSWQRVVTILLGVTTLFISLDFIVRRFPQINNSLYFTRPKLFEQIQAHTGLAFDRFLPAYSNNTTLISQHGLLKLAVGYLVVGILLLYGCYLSGFIPARWFKFGLVHRLTK